MKFALVNAHLPNYDSLAKLTTFGNRREYCNRHGYDLLVQAGNWTMPACHPVTWDRFKFMRGVLASGKYDWVYCCGTDTLHTNLKVPLTDLIDDKSHVIFSAEWCAPVQLDSFLVKNSKEALAWMDSILALYPKFKDHVWVEQQAVIETLPQWTGIVKSLPQRRMNAYDYSLYRQQYAGEPNVQKGLDYFGNDGQWHQGDFLIHWPGIYLTKRLELVAQYLPLVVK